MNKCKIVTSTKLRLFRASRFRASQMRKIVKTGVLLTEHWRSENGKIRRKIASTWWEKRKTPSRAYIIR